MRNRHRKVEARKVSTKLKSRLLLPTGHARSRIVRLMFRLRQIQGLGWLRGCYAKPTQEGESKEGEHKAEKQIVVAYRPRTWPYCPSEVRLFQDSGLRVWRGLNSCSSASWAWQFPWDLRLGLGVDGEPRARSKPKPTKDGGGGEERQGTTQMKQCLHHGRPGSAVPVHESETWVRVSLVGF